MIRHWLWPLLTAALALHAQIPESPTLVVQSGHSVTIEDAGFSPDGRWLVTVDNHNPPIVKVWELASGRMMRTFTIDRTAGIRSIGISPDNQSLVAAEYAGMSLWDFKTGKLTGPFTESAHGRLAAFSPDGKMLALSHNNGGLFLLSAATRRVVSGLSLHGCPCTFQFSHDGKMLAWASGLAFNVLGRRDRGDAVTDASIQLWDTAKARKITSFSGTAGEALSLAFSPDDHTLYSAHADRTIRAWNIATGTAAAQLHWDGKDARLSPDARWYSVLNANLDTELHEVATGRLLRKLNSTRGVFSPDGSTYAVLGLGALLVELPSGRLGAVLGSEIDTARAMAVSPDGSMLVNVEDFGFRVWYPANGSAQRYLRNPERDHFYAVTFSADSTLFASGTYAGGIDLWDAKTWKPVRRIAKEASAVAKLAFSPNQQWLASSPIAGKDEKKATTLYALSQSGGQPVTLEGRLAGFTKDGQLVTHDGKIVRVFDPASKQLARSFPDDVTLGFNNVQSDFTADSKAIATAGECCEVTLRDLANGRRIWQISDAYDSVRMSSDGRWMAVRRVREGIEIWDIAKRLKVRTLPAIAYQFAFWPDSKLLVTNNSDGSTAVWDVASGKQVAVLVGGSGKPDWVAVTPEGVFDGSSSGIQSLVAWRIGDKTFSPDRFFSQYYTPGLMANVFGGVAPKPVMNLAALKQPPEVHIVSPSSGVLLVHAEDKSGSIAQVRLFQNGKLVEARDAPAKSGGTVEFKFEVTLVAGDNVFKATAINREHSESNPDTLRVQHTAPAPAGPVLRVLAVGINSYDDSKFHLEFARQDAEAIAAFFSTRGKQLFQSVDVQTILDKQATRENIEQALAGLKTRANKQDVVILYLAGHGTALGDEFYFLTRGMHTDLDMPGTIRKFGISATDLGAALGKISSLKQLLVIDSCQSGLAIPAVTKAFNKRALGSTEQKAAEMLARSNGVYVIAAATTEQFAIEVPQLGHGVLAYALLSALGEKGPPLAPTTGDGFITALSLLQYVNQRVPELTEQYEDGQRQYPVSVGTGMDFPLLVAARR